MSVTTERGLVSHSNKAFFSALEDCKRDDTRPLPEVIDRLSFNDKGLIPVVTQDVRTGEVLMLAWMNRNALTKTLVTGLMTYFSRSRNQLWIKGETSGNYQNVIDLRIDCDGDALLCRVEQRGNACHTDRKSCFYLAAQSTSDLVRVLD